MAKHYKNTTSRWSTPQWVLAIGLAIFAIATLAGLIVQWPHSSEEPKVTPAYQNSGYAGPLTSGEVLFTRAAKCGATEIGVTSEAIPEDKNPFAEKHCTQVIVRLTDGTDEGKYTALESRHMPGEPELHEGDSIKLIHSNSTYAFQDYDRTGPLWAWVLATIVLIIAVGRWRGLRALVGLAITMVMILVFLLPALLRGGSPLWLAVTTAATVILLVVFLVHGVNWKSAAAMGGSLVAVAIATALSGLAIDSTSLRGLGDESNLQILLYLPELDITGLMLAGMIIGALGVLNDATIAQASTITELKRAGRRGSHRFDGLHPGAGVRRCGDPHDAAAEHLRPPDRAGADLGRDGHRAAAFRHGRDRVAAGDSADYRHRGCDRGPKQQGFGARAYPQPLGLNS